VSSERAGAAAFAFAQLERPTPVAAVADALQTARREADMVREQARAEGYSEGRAAGLAEAHAQAQAALSALAQAAGEVHGAREALMAELERDALKLAFDLAEQVLAGALDVQPQRVLDVARHALRHLGERRQVTLVVNPDDLDLVSEGASDLQAQLGGIEHLAVQADRRVGRGGVIARTQTGEIDAGIAAQLARARELVGEALAVDLSGDGGEDG
jgi:flagellar assembly protein FliH